MRRGYERRIARLNAAFDQAMPALARERDALAARRILAQAVRAGLARAGIDPRAASALRAAVLPAPYPAGEAAATLGITPHAVLAGRLAALGRRYRAEGPPALADASFAVLLSAYCRDGAGALSA